MYETSDQPKKILVIGEAPSGRTAGGLTRTRISELAGTPWEEWADWINLLDEWPGRGSGKGSAWDARAAKTRADRMLADGFGYDRVIVLGRRAAGVLIPGGAGFPFFRWIERAGSKVAVIPHTSGIVRFWNDPGNVQKAREFLAEIVPTNPHKEEEMPREKMTDEERKEKNAKRMRDARAAARTNATRSRSATQRPKKAKAEPTVVPAAPIVAEAEAVDAAAAGVVSPLGSLADDLVAAVREAVTNVERKPSGQKERLTTDEKTFCYFAVGKRVVSVEAKTESGYQRIPVKTPAEIPAAVAALTRSAAMVVA